MAAAVLRAMRRKLVDLRLPRRLCDCHRVVRLVLARHDAAGLAADLGRPGLREWRRDTGQRPCA